MHTHGDFSLVTHWNLLNQHLHRHFSKRWFIFMNTNVRACNNYTVLFIEAIGVFILAKFYCFVDMEVSGANFNTVVYVSTTYKI